MTDREDHVKKGIAMRRSSRLLLLSTLSLSAPGPFAAAQNAPGQPWDSVADILKTPAVPSAGYTRFNFPRGDLTVRMGDVALAIPLASGAWAGFAGTTKRATVMGDLVLTSQELKPVLTELERQRIEVTGIHNHLVGEEPRLVYVHFHAMGAAVEVAARLDTVLARTAIPRPVAAATAAPLTIDTALVFSGLGRSGHAHGGLAQLGFDLVHRRVRWRGETLVPALAYGTPINIQAMSPTRAAATGDFAVLAAQVPRVLAAFAESGITAQALHTHMIGESPQIYFIHFWADGPLADVVRGLKAALDAAR
jgi:hypothetical protein